MPIQTEKEFEAQVKQLAELLGWKYYHTYRSKHSPAGFPDCVMVRDGRLIFAELKTGRCKPSPEQFIWMAALNDTPNEVYLWYPGDWDEITRILR